MEKATARLYRNGSVIYRDEEDKKIAELEELGLSGLHEFVKRYPDGRVFWCFSYERTRIPPTALLHLLKHLRTSSTDDLICEFYPNPKDTPFCADGSVIGTVLCTKEYSRECLWAIQKREEVMKNDTSI